MPGIVDQLGEGVETDIKVGDEIIAMVVPSGNYGAYREQIVLDQNAVVRAPKGTTHIEACTLPMNSLTARLSLDLLGLKEGQVLAVTGSPGAYGGYVVQLAKADGLTVVADSNESDEELLKSENIENIDVFCALTNDDETNIMSAFLAKKLGAKKTIIIVNNYTYINILPKNFVDIALSPQRLTVSMVLQHLAEGDVPQDVIFKMGSGAEAIEGIVHQNKFTNEFLNKPISEIPLPENCVVAAVTRNDQTFMGSDELLLCPGDRLIIFILGKTDKEKIQNLFLED